MLNTQPLSGDKGTEDSEAKVTPRWHQRPEWRVFRKGGAAGGHAGRRDRALRDLGAERQMWGVGAEHR